MREQDPIDLFGRFGRAEQISLHFGAAKRTQ
jgi:hypothetical protein